MSIREDSGRRTRAIHGGVHPERWEGAISPPIYQSSTFAFASTDQGARRFSGAEEGWIYTRLGNPTTHALEESVAGLEDSAHAIATASGMAAVNGVYFALLEPGARVVASRALYGPSRVILEKEYARFGVESVFIDTSDPAAIEREVTKGTRLLFVETPTNPTLAVTDLAHAAAVAHEAGALLAVDNTFMSPYLQQPLRHGADVVIHSMTKFLNGHGDVVAGMIVIDDAELFARVAWVVRNLGGTMDPHQAWLVHRGLRTLPMRMERAQENAIVLARWLADHEKVETVSYPGLPGHPAEKLIGGQMLGPGALLAFEVKGGIEAGKKVLDSVQVMTLAVSLGGVETLIQHPASMTHASVDPAARLEAGITDGLVRVSVGCEDYEDLRADLERALSGI